VSNNQSTFAFLKKNQIINNMRLVFTLSFIISSICLNAQSASIKGQLQDKEKNPISFANVALYSTSDSSLVKVETSDESGLFQLSGINEGNYFLSATYVGVGDLRKSDINLTTDQILDLGVLVFGESSIELSEVIVTADRAMVEVKPDRMVFNVQGTINSVGSDAIELLRKAPGVTVDNNDNINVLGRSGVLLYVDGKRLPLSGNDLSNYLKNIPAEQIDKIDIITNPGAKYEAQGNAGIIDIQLKRDKNLGTNGTINSTVSQGEFTQMNGGISANHRNKMMNIFGSVGASDNDRFHSMLFEDLQNGIFKDESNRMEMSNQNINYRLGTDFFLSEKHTMGFLVNGNYSDGLNETVNTIGLYDQNTINQVDSFLVANSDQVNKFKQNSFNVNYRFDNKKGRSVNLDLDYGKFTNDATRYQPNRYYTDDTQDTVLSEVINSFETPTDIDIYTFKIDFENDLLGGKLGLGSKLSRVASHNTFLFFEEMGGIPIQNDRKSNIFTYDEDVYAGYVSYARPINEKWNFSAGVRAEYTDIYGDLQTFVDELQEPPVDTSYLSFFPSAGLTWQVSPSHLLALNYGRRINRPDYNVLNPFNNQLSELSFQKGNPFLKPEIVNNIELGYTLKYRYNFKIAYSKTDDQITRLISPDEENPKAGFITWDNLATQTVWSANISAPVQLTKIWNAYFNISASHINNQADYGDGAIVDVQAFTYSIFQQHTFDLPWKLKAEVSGYFSGPGVWGGVFKYESNGALNLGLQRKFIQDKLNVRISANDILYTSGWNGVSIFNGLESRGSGNWDSRRVSLSLSYGFGNQNVKSRKRKTGLEDEAKRVNEN
jgi:iron complex outermembrane recepter protein